MGSDHHLEKLLIVKQILLVAISVGRICILMLGCEGLKAHSNRGRAYERLNLEVIRICFKLNLKLWIWAIATHSCFL